MNAIPIRTEPCSARRRIPKKVHFVFDVQSTNAPGAQITPGSDEVGADFQDVMCRHGRVLGWGDRDGRRERYTQVTATHPRKKGVWWARRFAGSAAQSRPGGVGDIEDGRRPGLAHYLAALDGDIPDQLKASAWRYAFAMAHNLRLNPRDSCEQA